MRVLAEAIIQELGHETLTAGTAEQALAVIEERPDVDLLFTDIGLQQDLEAGLQRSRYAWALLRRWDCAGGRCCAIARWL